MKKLILISLFIITSFSMACAIKAADKITGIEKVADKVDATAKIVGVDKSQTKETNQSVGRDITNDSEMIEDLFAKNEEMVSKLISSYKFIINVLIIQLCGLLALFIRKDEKITTQLIKFISDNEERDDKK